MAVPHDSTRPNLQQLLATTQLAALPQSAIRLLELSRDPNCGPADYAAPIEVDPGMAGQVLKFVNSSYFGFARKISSVKVGISLVGVRTIENFALWNAVFSLVPNPRCGPFDLKSIWQDSLRRALFARAVAKLQGLKATEEIFTAALLQDMAVPLLAKEFPQIYVKLLEGRNDGRRRLSSLEGEAFGWTHGQAAGLLARQWNLPEEFATLIEGHSGALDGQDPSDLGGRIVAPLGHAALGRRSALDRMPAVGRGLQQDLSFVVLAGGPSEPDRPGVHGIRSRAEVDRAAEVAGRRAPGSGRAGLKRRLGLGACCENVPPRPENLFAALFA